ncbi:heparanase-like [Liolophura sinensis]|uniref:heparanase-like n=1 Tax=Liolophura sinensis TaxID=3198878 RepID=UPI00315848B8
MRSAQTANRLIGRFLVDDNTITVTVGTRAPVHTVSEKFLSVTMDTFEIHVHLRDFHPSSQKFRNLAKGLSPAYWRIGGTYADRLFFRNAPLGGVAMSEEEFDSINKFCRDVGWEMIFDLNLLNRKNGVWDSTDAESLLRYAANKGYKLNFELGNEPELYFRVNKKVDPVQLGRDYVKLRHLMNSIPPYDQRLLVGPALIASFHPDFVQKFMSTGSSSIDALTVHHYYTGGPNATEEEFLSAHRMDSLLYTLNPAADAMAKYSKRSNLVWLAETSSRSGGGAPGLSESFIAGFLWLDKLGLSATKGVDMVARQTLLGGHYGLLTIQGEPLPDYWLSLLFKRLVGRRVLHVTSSDNNRRIRIYAHCSANDLTFFYQNMQNGEVRLAIPQFSQRSYQLYTLTAGGNGALTSKTVKLNGHELHMNGDHLPDLRPTVSTTWPVKVPSYSFGFLVFKHPNVAACH